MKGLAIASMVLGIIAICLAVFSCGLLSPISVILAIIGVIFAGVSLNMYKTATEKSGKGMATTGMVLSLIVLIIAIIIMFSCGGLALLSGGAASSGY
jgi:hypothetical protein